MNRSGPYYILQTIIYFSRDNTTVEPENGQFWPLNTALLAPMPPTTQTNAQTPLLGPRRTPFDTSPARIAQFSKIVPSRDDPRAIVPYRDEISDHGYHISQNTKHNKLFYYFYSYQRLCCLLHSILLRRPTYQGRSLCRRWWCSTLRERIALR